MSAGGEGGFGQRSSQFSWVHSLGKEICKTGIHKGACPFSQTSNSKGGPHKLGHQKKHQLWPANSHENLVSIRAESDCVSTGVEMGPDCDRSTGFKRRCFSPTPMGELVNTIDASSTACMYFSMSCQCLATACHQAIFFFRFFLLMLSGIVRRGHGLRLVSCLPIPLPITSLSWTTNILNFHWWSVP